MFPSRFNIWSVDHIFSYKSIHSRFVRRWSFYSVLSAKFISLSWVESWTGETGARVTNVTFNGRVIKRARTLFQWNWTRYVEAVFENTNVTINPAVDRVIVVDLQYLQKLPLLLSITPPATIGTSNFAPSSNAIVTWRALGQTRIAHRCLSTYVRLREER